MGQRRIGFEQSLKFFLAIGFIPSWKMEMMGIHFLEILIGIRKGIRAICVLVVHIRAEPVEDRHEVVANHFDSGFGDAANVFDVIFDITIAGRASEFDVFVDGNRFDDFHL